MLTDPQRFNLYSYVRNSPLTLTDPTGQAIELTGDEEARKKELDALKNGVGAKAGSYLYDNAVTDKDGNTSHYVGILAGGPDGKGPAFDSINDASGALGSIIRDTDVASLGVVNSGTGMRDDHGNQVVIGPSPNSSPGFSGQFANKLMSYIMDTTHQSPGQLPGADMSNGQPGTITPGMVVFHELGHQWYDIKHPFIDWMTGYRGSPGSTREALDLENKVRQIQNPGSPTRKQH